MGRRRPSPGNSGHVLRRPTHTYSSTYTSVNTTTTTTTKRLCWAGHVRAQHLRGKVLGEKSVRLETAAGHDDEDVERSLAASKTNKRSGGEGKGQREESGNLINIGTRTSKRDHMNVPGIAPQRTTNVRRLRRLERKTCSWYQLCVR